MWEIHASKSDLGPKTTMSCLFHSPTTKSLLEMKLYTDYTYVPLFFFKLAANCVEDPILVFDTHSVSGISHEGWGAVLFQKILTDYYGCGLSIMWTHGEECQEETGRQPESSWWHVQAHDVLSGVWVKNKLGQRDLLSGWLLQEEAPNTNDYSLVSCRHMCVCIRTYIIHALQGSGQRRKYSTYITHGKMVSGDRRGPAYPWGRRCC